MWLCSLPVLLDDQGDGGDLLLHFQIIFIDLKFIAHRCQFLQKHIKYQSRNMCLISHALEKKLYGLNMLLLDNIYTLYFLLNINFPQRTFLYKVIEESGFKVEILFIHSENTLAITILISNSRYFI